MDALLTREPAWSAVRDALGRALAVTGPVVLEGATGKKYRYVVRINVPKDFPHPDAHPDVWLHESPFPHAEAGHVDELGNVCVELPRAHELDYEQLGLVGYFDHVVLHLDRLRIQALTRKYPGPEYAHGDEGIRELVTEVHARATAHIPPGLVHAALPGVPVPPRRQWCPCGSGKRFGECHRAELMEARAKVAAVGPLPKRGVSRPSRNPFKRFR